MDGQMRNSHDWLVDVNQMVLQFVTSLLIKMSLVAKICKANTTDGKSVLTELWQACLVHISSTKTNISKVQFDLETVERRATPWILLKFPFIIYLFIYL